MSKKPYLVNAIVLIIGIGGGYLLNDVVKHQPVGPPRHSTGRNMTMHDVVKFCSKLDEEGWTWSDLHKSDEFLFLRDHLQEALANENIGKSSVFTGMVWRAAVLFGDWEDFSVAAAKCWDFTSDVTTVRIPHDVAADTILARWLIVGGGSTPQFLKNMLEVLRTRDPSEWGVVDYTPYLVHLMDESPDVEIRIPAAYVLARWRADREEGEAAHKILSELAAQNVLAKTYLEALSFDMMVQSGSRPSE